ncbi:NADH dehydrogenase 1 alpha subcomplex [Gautieria morchelliformis]|nr:NADH dehydrogenase 1 alpha subcomplex [Gautieria morchelliformis]KAF8507599.1 NADH dehydrogenase 1 alpha subcomplex [Gautieria morchelliformis]
MPVPWEALIPFGLLTTMFAATGTLLNISKRAQNDGKPPRYGVDAWDEMMMERDRRLTGSHRGQRTDPVAPEGFETSSVWYTESRL